MQQLNPAEISDIIRGRIENLDVSAQAANEGTIVSVSDGIVRVHGLAEAQYGEMIEFTGGLFGMALNLERDSVGCVVLGEYEKALGRHDRPLHEAHPRSSHRPRTSRPGRGRAR